MDLKEVLRVIRQFTPRSDKNKEAASGLDENLFGDMGLGKSFPVESFMPGGDHKKAVDQSFTPQPPAAPVESNLS
jgi:hypothetical protein